MTTATITGPIYGLNQNFEFVSMQVVFELSSWDQEEDVGLFAAGPVIVPVDVNGNFSVDLFVNSKGQQETHYQCFLQYRKTDGTSWIREPIGIFSLVESGVYPISNLHFTSLEPKINTTLDVYSVVKNIEKSILNNLSLNRYVRNTLVDLNGISEIQNNDIGYVLADGVNTGSYEHNGSAWVRVADLPPALADSASILAALDGKASLSQLAFNGKFLSVVQLANIGGTGDAVTAELPEGVTGANMHLGGLMAVKWPATNSTGQPTLSVTDSTNTYDITIINAAAGGLVANNYYLVAFDGNNGTDANGQIVGVTNIEEITGLQAALDAINAELSAIEFGGETEQMLSRPGDVPSAWGKSSTGLPEDATPIDAGDIVTTEDGRVLRMNGVQVRAPVGWYRLDPTRQYAVRVIYRRPSDVADPAGAAVHVVARWLDRYGASLGTTVLDQYVPKVSDGRRVVSAVVASVAGSGVDAVAAAGAVYWRPYIATFQADSVTDLESVEVFDITDLGGYAPDLSDVTARVAALEGENLSARLVAVEAATTAPDVVRYKTRTDAQAANIPTSADFVEVQAYSTATPAAVAIYRRAASASTGSFQSADGAHWVPAWAETRLQMLGGIGDDAADDQAAWNTARFLGKPIYLDHGLVFRVTDPLNTLGVPIRGPGKLVTVDADGPTRWNLQNERSGKANPHFLNVVQAKWITYGHAEIAIMGNSTATNSYGLNITTFVQDRLRQMGLGVAGVLNQAVGGTSPASTDMAALMDAWPAQKDLLIIKYDGINMLGSQGDDMQSNMEAYRNALRGDLAAIRAHTYGAVADLSILAIGMTPMENTALVPGSNKTNVWAPEYREILREACREFRIAFYDPMTEAFWADGESGVTLDANGVHLLEEMNRWVWGRALEMCRPYGAERNAFVNRGNSDGPAPASSSNITSFPMGQSVLRAFSSDGYPFSGVLKTIRHPDNTAEQVLFDYSYTFARVKRRQWVTGPSAWSAWAGDAAAITLEAGFERYNTTLAPAQARRTSEGLVTLEGALKGTGPTTGAVPNLTLIGTLPVGYRPSYQMRHHVVDRLGTIGNYEAIVVIETNGQIKSESGCTYDYIGLGGINFWSSI